jgi:hypothetical protein
VGAGGAGCPEGGYLDLHPPREHEFPGQYLPQYEDTDSHQLENSKHFMLSGHPAWRKQEAV